MKQSNIATHCKCENYIQKNGPPWRTINFYLSVFWQPVCSVSPLLALHPALLFLVFQFFLQQGLCCLSLFVPPVLLFLVVLFLQQDAFSCLCLFVLSVFLLLPDCLPSSVSALA